MSDSQNPLELPEHEIQNWNNLFNLKSANEWMEDTGQKPQPEALFGDFWLEGELSILFSDTNRGKSTLAMQIAESLARGKPVAPFEAVPSAQKVLYLDFELSDRQFESRYSTISEAGTRHRYRFSDNLLRAQTAVRDHLPPGFETMAEFIHHSFVTLVRETGARIVIVDNITFLKGANENASAAVQLMKALKHLKEYYGVSMLVLAHTPKLPYTSPFSLNDMQGSKMLSNFADNVFAIGASNQAKDLRYLKHLKPRSSEIQYDASNVILYRITKAYSFLQFEFESYARERDHLVWRYDCSDGERAKLMIVAKRLYAQGASQRRVAMIMGISHRTVGRYLRAATPGDHNILKEDDIQRVQEENV
ncbi:MAG TPA: AAA family ATPase [Pyrinomonadaceae bacterium]|jgi:RecA-family ATPase|nr:AAA family ATPase [Pyrinomonadaceae bacterium]